MLFYCDDFFNNGTLKGAITTAERLWDGGIIPYEIDEILVSVICKFGFSK